MRTASKLVGVAGLLLTALMSRVDLAQADDILIGFHGATTGPASWIGLGGRDGAMLALNEINAAGGVDGRKLRLVVYDDANRPSEAEAVSIKMIDSDKVFAILGGGASNTAVVVAEAAARGKVPYLNGVGTIPKVMDLKSRWVFSGATIDARDIAEDEAAFIGRYLKPKRVGIINVADEAAKPFVDAAVKQLKQNYGIETLAQETYDRGDTDFTSQLIAVSRAKPDLLVLSGPYAETARIILQARQLGVRVPIDCDTGAMNSGLLTIAGPAAEGIYVSYVARYFTGDPERDMAEFEARYQKAYPTYPPDRPNFLDMFGYGNMYALAEGLRRTGSDVTRRHFVQALETLDSFQPSRNWPQAADVIEPLTFTTSHNGNRRMGFFVVKKGVFTKVTGFSPPAPSQAFPTDDTLAW